MGKYINWHEKKKFIKVTIMYYQNSFEYNLLPILAFSYNLYLLTSFGVPPSSRFGRYIIKFLTTGFLG